MEQAQTSPELSPLPAVPAVPSSTIKKPANRKRKSVGTQEGQEAPKANPRAHKKAKTVEEKAAENQRKRNKLRQAKEDAVNAHWKPFDLKKICWVLPPIDEEREFARFKGRFGNPRAFRNITKLDLFWHLYLTRY